LASEELAQVLPPDDPEWRLPPDDPWQRLTSGDNERRRRSGSDGKQLGRRLGTDGEWEYPGEVAHNVVARVYTDTDTGEHCAELLANLDNHEVTEWQDNPADPKVITGRNAGYLIDTMGTVEIDQVPERDEHTVEHLADDGEQRLVDTSGNIKARAAAARESAAEAAGSTGPPSTSNRRWIPPHLRPKFNVKVSRAKAPKSDLAKVGKRRHGLS